MKRLLFLFLAFAVLNSSYASYTPAGEAKDAEKGSGIKEIWLHDTKTKELSYLGVLWGFIKYHHPEATKGKRDMDAELFRVLPNVIAAANTDSAYAVMERWLDEFGKVRDCPKCKPKESKDSVYLKPDYDLLLSSSIPPSLKDKLQHILDNRPRDKKQHYVKAAKNIDNPEFTNERDYTAPYPDAGVRLLALYRYWNMIQYFCPNRHLTAGNWSRTLVTMIPDFCNATDTLQYQLACLKLITRLNDTHGLFIPGVDAISTYKGHYILPVIARFIEDKLVVTGYSKDTLDIKNTIKPGDIIEQIDGVTIADLMRKYIDYTPASNYEEKRRCMLRTNGFILRSNNTAAKLSVVRNGSIQQLTVPRIPVDKSMTIYNYGTGNDAGYKMLDGNIGYMYPAKMQHDDFKTITDSFEHTKGIVIDMRCYPNLFMTFDYGQWFKAESSPFVRFSKVNVETPGLIEMNSPINNGGGKGPHYKGKLIILVNENTQSSAEYQTMALQSKPGTIVMGSQTSGADGDVSEIVLPGDIHTYISGLGILYPDATETQGAGVRIDKEIRPTIKGIATGRDEVLEAALQLINE